MAQFNRPTTTDLITNGKYSSDATGTIVETLGFTTEGDGGGAQWQKTGNTITASQTPAQLVDAKCSDSAGNEFELVVATAVNLKAFGVIDDGVTDDTSAHTAALSSGAPYFSTSGMVIDITGTFSITPDLAYGYVRIDSGTPVSVNVLATSSTILDRAEIHLRQVGTGVTTVVPSAGITVNPPAGGTLVLGGQNATVTLKKVSDTEWDLIGQVQASA